MTPSATRKDDRRRGRDWDEGRAVRYLLSLLARRDYARAELHGRLARKGVPAGVAEAALARLAELDLLDDGRVAEAFVRAHAHRKGRRALERDMARRGVAEEARAAALAPLDDAQQNEAATAVLRKHAWRFASGDRRKDRAKAAGFLTRRGFDGDVVQRAVEAALPPDADDDPP
ncbi:MAG: RecX family transcriptional regulator [Trueperaceae bacterium]|nr:RecX family transcriptional regulator [Trueperaceae bacterium]